MIRFRKQPAAVETVAPRNNHRFLSLLILAIVLPIAISSIALWRWASSPAEETSIKPVSAVVVAPDKPQTVRTAAYSFEVPADFRVRTVVDKENPELIHTQVLETSSTGRQAGITVNRLPTEGLAGVADYNLRAKISDAYHPYKPADLPSGAVAFGNREAGEVTLFWVRDGRYAVIAVSGISGNGRLRGLLQQIYTTWQWL